MSEQMHTPEPWKVKDADCGYITTKDGSHGICSAWGCSATPQEKSANARRIVACVNACAGVRTETLEQVPLNQSTKDMVARIEAAEKQRDHLQRQLEISHEWADTVTTQASKDKMALEQQCDQLLAAHQQVDECFEAALAEGWVDALADGDIERIRDIYSRRIYYARGVSVTAIAAAGGTQ